MEGEDDSSSEAGSDDALDLRDIRMLLGMPGRDAGAEDVPREVLMRQLFAMVMMDQRHQPNSQSSPQEWNDQLVSAVEKSTQLQSANVIAAFRAVDRGDFVPPEHREQAYHDRPFRKTITRTSGQAVLHMSQPGMYAQAVDSLMIRPGDSILNVGSGSGYLSTIFAFLVGPSGCVHGVEIQEGMIEYAQQMFEQFNFPESRIPEAEPPAKAPQQNETLISQSEYDRSYIEMVAETPSAPPAWATEWNVVDHIGFWPPSNLQMAQQRLAFALLLTSQVHDRQRPTLGLIPDLVETVCTRAGRLQFPRVGAEVKFQQGNALAIDTDHNRLYDRIYVGAQGSATDLSHFQALLAPGGCLVGPFDGDFVCVRRGEEERSDDFQVDSLMHVAYAPLVRPDNGEHSVLVAPPPAPKMKPPPLLAASPSSTTLTPLVESPIRWSSRTTVSVGPTGAATTFLTRTQVSVPKSTSTTIAVRTGPDKISD